MSQSDGSTIGYVVKRYPRYSETFIVTEILAHEEVGAALEVFALRPSCDTHFQHEIARVRAPVTFLPSAGIRTTDFWDLLQQAARRVPNVWASLAEVEHADARDVWQAAVLAQHVLDRGIAHLHAHFATSPATVTRLAAKMAGITYSVTAHAKDIYGPDVRTDDLRRKLEDASAFITVSDHNVEYLRRTCEHAPGKIHRIYNGLPLEEFPYASPDERDPLIVAVGRFVEKKGLVDLIDACAVLAESGRDFRCEIIGGGPLEATLRERIAQRRLSAHVRLAGPQPRTEVARRMQQAAVFAAPCVISTDGDRDGLPTVLVEAMALGTPVVATDVTGIPELVHHDRTGLIVRQRDPSRLAAALDGLLSNPDLRVRLATGARALVEDSFDVRCNARAIRELLYNASSAPTQIVAEVV